MTALFDHDELVALGAADVHFAEDPNRAEHVEMDAVYFVSAVDAALARTLSADFRMLTQTAQHGETGPCACLNRLLYVGMGSFTYDARRYRAAHVFSQTPIAPDVVTQLKANELLYSATAARWSGLKTLCVVELDYVALDEETFAVGGGGGAGGSALAELFPSPATAARWAAEEAKGAETGHWERTTDAIAARLASVVRTVAPAQKVHVCAAQSTVARRVATQFAAITAERLRAEGERAAASGAGAAAAAAAAKRAARRGAKYARDTHVIVLDRTIDAGA